MLFSIIIPAYNSEKFISYCLESVARQNFPRKEFEVIVVDDKSPDNQAKVIEDFVIDSSKNNNTTIHFLHHTTNKKQGGGRNTGIMSANGDYIIFLDSDDYWRNSNLLMLFYTLIKKYPEAEILESSSYSTEYKYGNYSDSTPNIINEICQTPNEYYSESHHPCIWTACYKKVFIEKYPFRENVMYEDCDWKIKVFTSAKRIISFDFPFYAYIENPFSTTRHNSEKRFLDAFITDQICIKEWEKCSLDESLKKRILSGSKIFYIKSILKIRDYQASTGVRLLRNIKDDLKKYYDQDKVWLPLSKKILLYGSIRFPYITAITIRTATHLKRMALKLKNRHEAIY